MVLSRVIRRFIHLQPPCSAAVEKSFLATLRKKTGYTFSNCKKALDMHQNDLIQAEKWLRDQAQTLGWTKATKLEGRRTSQGLVAVTVNDKNAALVEINCETDFVAKNHEFRKMTEIAATTCLNFIKNHSKSQSHLTKVGLDADQIQNLTASDGKSLADHLALMIGSVGENASLKRALCFKVTNDLILAGYAHPSGMESGDVLFGKFGGVVVLKKNALSDADAESLGKNLCQHIVGLNPKRIGTMEDEPSKNQDEEPCLIHQEYLLDEGVTVGEILTENDVEVVYFKRFACGECDVDQFEMIETCQ